MEQMRPLAHEDKDSSDQLDLHSYEALFSAFEDSAPKVISLARVLEPLIDRAERTVGRNNPSQDKLDTEGSYLGSGSVKIAMIIEGNDGEKYALKVLKQSPDQPTTLDNEVAPLLNGRDIPHLEQLVAIDRESNTFVTSLAPGKKVTELKPREITRIKKDHLLKLNHTLAIMRERGLHPHNAGGVLYDDTEGFTFVDYTFDNPDSWAGTNRGSNESTNDFLYYVLADLKKFDELMAFEQDGMNVPSGAYTTSTRRALARAIVQRRAKKAIR